MESDGFEHWTPSFGTEDFAVEQLTLDYIDAILITYAPSDFLRDFSYRNGRKVV